MVILLEGLNKIRDLHRDDVDKAQMGTDGTAPNESQTGLQSAVAASKIAVTKTYSDKINVFDYLCPSTSATGNTFREVEIMNDTDSIDYDRITFTGIAHTANDDVIIKKTWFYRNPE